MRSLAASLVGLALACGAALATDPPSFDDVDSDGNGKLSGSEAAAVEIDLKKADTNGDGSLSPAEFRDALGRADKSES